MGAGNSVTAAEIAGIDRDEEETIPIRFQVEPPTEAQFRRRKAYRRFLHAGGLHFFRRLPRQSDIPDEELIPALWLSRQLGFDDHAFLGLASLYLTARKRSQTFDSATLGDSNRSATRLRAAAALMGTAGAISPAARAAAAARDPAKREGTATGRSTGGGDAADEAIGHRRWGPSSGIAGAGRTPVRVDDVMAVLGLPPRNLIARQQLLSAAGAVPGPAGQAAITALRAEQRNLLARGAAAGAMAAAEAGRRAGEERARQLTRARSGSLSAWAASMRSVGGSSGTDGAAHRAGVTVASRNSRRVVPAGVTTTVVEPGSALSALSSASGGVTSASGGGGRVGDPSLRAALKQSAPRWGDASKSVAAAAGPALGRPVQSATMPGTQVAGGVTSETTGAPGEVEREGWSERLRGDLTGFIGAVWALGSASQDSVVRGAMGQRDTVTRDAGWVTVGELLGILGSALGLAHGTLVLLLPGMGAAILRVAAEASREALASSLRGRHGHGRSGGSGGVGGRDSRQYSSSGGDADSGASWPANRSEEVAFLLASGLGMQSIRQALRDLERQRRHGSGFHFDSGWASRQFTFDGNRHGGGKDGEEEEGNMYASMGGAGGGVAAVGTLLVLPYPDGSVALSAPAAAATALLGPKGLSLRVSARALLRAGAQHPLLLAPLLAGRQAVRTATDAAARDPKAASAQVPPSGPLPPTAQQLCALAAVSGDSLAALAARCLVAAMAGVRSARAAALARALYPASAQRQYVVPPGLGGDGSKSSKIDQQHQQVAVAGLGQGHRHNLHAQSSVAESAADEARVSALLAVRHWASAARLPVVPYGTSPRRGTDAGKGGTARGSGGDELPTAPEAPRAAELPPCEAAAAAAKAAVESALGALAGDDPELAKPRAALGAAAAAALRLPPDVCRSCASTLRRSLEAYGVTSGLPWATSGLRSHAPSAVSGPLQLLQKASETACVEATGLGGLGAGAAATHSMASSRAYSTGWFGGGGSRASSSVLGWWGRGLVPPQGPPRSELETKVRVAESGRWTTVEGYRQEGVARGIASIEAVEDEIGRQLLQRLMPVASMRQGEAQRIGRSLAFDDGSGLEMARAAFTRTSEHPPFGLMLPRGGGYLAAGDVSIERDIQAAIEEQKEEEEEERMGASRGGGRSTGRPWSRGSQASRSSRRSRSIGKRRGGRAAGRPPALGTTRRSSSRGSRGRGSQGRGRASGAASASPSPLQEVESPVVTSGAGDVDGSAASAPQLQSESGGGMTRGSSPVPMGKLATGTVPHGSTASIGAGGGARRPIASGPLAAWAQQQQQQYTGTAMYANTQAGTDDGTATSEGTASRDASRYGASSSSKAAVPPQGPGLRPPAGPRAARAPVPPSRRAGQPDSDASAFEAQLARTETAEGIMGARRGGTDAMGRREAGYETRDGAYTGRSSRPSLGQGQGTRARRRSRPGPSRRQSLVAVAQSRSEILSAAAAAAAIGGPVAYSAVVADGLRYQVAGSVCKDSIQSGKEGFGWFDPGFEAVAGRALVGGGQSGGAGETRPHQFLREAGGAVLRRGPGALHGGAGGAQVERSSRAKLRGAALAVARQRSGRELRAWPDLATVRAAGPAPRLGQAAARASGADKSKGRSTSSSKGSYANKRRKGALDSSPLRSSATKGSNRTQVLKVSHAGPGPGPRLARRSTGGELLAEALAELAKVGSLVASSAGGMAGQLHVLEYESMPGLDSEQLAAARAFGRAQRDRVLGWARSAAVEQGLKLPGGLDAKHLTVGALQAAFGNADRETDGEDGDDGEGSGGEEGPGSPSPARRGRANRRQSQSGAAKALRAALLDAARLRPGSVASAAHPSLALWAAWSENDPGALLPLLMEGPVARAVRARDEMAVAAAVREARRTATSDLKETLLAADGGQASKKLGHSIGWRPGVYLRDASMAKYGALGTGDSDCDAAPHRPIESRLDEAEKQAKQLAERYRGAQELAAGGASVAAIKSKIRRLKQLAAVRRQAAWEAVRAHGDYALGDGGVGLVESAAVSSKAKSSSSGGGKTSSGAGAGAPAGGDSSEESEVVKDEDDESVSSGQSRGTDSFSSDEEHSSDDEEDGTAEKRLVVDRDAALAGRKGSGGSTSEEGEDEEKDAFEQRKARRQRRREAAQIAAKKRMLLRGSRRRRRRPSNEGDLVSSNPSSEGTATSSSDDSESESKKPRGTGVDDKKKTAAAKETGPDGDLVDPILGLPADGRAFTRTIERRRRLTPPPVPPPLKRLIRRVSELVPVPNPVTGGKYDNDGLRAQAELLAEEQEAVAVGAPLASSKESSGGGGGSGGSSGSGSGAAGMVEAMKSAALQGGTAGRVLPRLCAAQLLRAMMEGVGLVKLLDGDGGEDLDEDASVYEGDSEEEDMVKGGAGGGEAQGEDLGDAAVVEDTGGSAGPGMQRRPSLFMALRRKSDLQAQRLGLEDGSVDSDDSTSSSDNSRGPGGTHAQGTRRSKASKGTQGSSLLGTQIGSNLSSSDEERMGGEQGSQGKPRPKPAAEARERARLARGGAESWPRRRQDRVVVRRAVVREAAAFTGTAGGRLQRATYTQEWKQGLAAGWAKAAWLAEMGAVIVKRAASLDCLPAGTLVPLRRQAYALQARRERAARRLREHWVQAREQARELERDAAEIRLREDAIKNAAVRGELLRAADRLRWLLDRWEHLDPATKRAMEAQKEAAKRRREEAEARALEQGKKYKPPEEDDDDRGKLSNDYAWKLALEERVQRERAAAGQEVGERYDRLEREQVAINRCFQLAAAAAGAWAEQYLGPGVGVLREVPGGWRHRGEEGRRERRRVERWRREKGWAGRRARGCVRQAGPREERGRRGRRRLWRRWITILALGGMPVGGKAAGE